MNAISAITPSAADASQHISPLRGPVAETVVHPSCVQSPLLADSLLNFVARAMADPAINVDKLEVLLRMQREIVADDARLQFNRAMTAVQAAMLPVVRDANNSQTNSKYARLETIDAMMRPIYSRHGFCLTFNAEPMDGANVRIACEVAHTAGHAKTYRLDAALDMAGPHGKANKTPLHGLGSSVSYLRRYLMAMIFNLVLANEDNGGNRTRDDGEVIDRAPVAELYALLADCSADPTATATNERSFLKKMGLGDLRSMLDAPARDFPRMRNALLTKKNVLEQRATATRAAAARQTQNGDARP